MRSAFEPARRLKKKAPGAPETFHRDSNLSRITTHSMCVGQERGTGLAALVNLGWTLQESWGAPISFCLGVPPAARLLWDRARKPGRWSWPVKWNKGQTVKTWRRVCLESRVSPRQFTTFLFQVPGQEEEVSRNDSVGFEIKIRR